MFVKYAYLFPMTIVRPSVCKEAASQFKSRGECISTETAIRCADLRGRTDPTRKDCQAEVKDFCDCAVFHGCTDLPPGPPSDE